MFQDANEACIAAQEAFLQLREKGMAARRKIEEIVKAMAEKKPERVVCLDAGFADNDQLKTNAVQTMKSKGVTKFQTV